MYVTLVLVGLVAGTLSGSVGFGGGMILLPVITYFYGVEVAVPVSTIAQMMSNISRAAMGWKEIKWRQGGMVVPALPFTALGLIRILHRRQGTYDASAVRLPDSVLHYEAERENAPA